MAIINESTFGTKDSQAGLIRSAAPEDAADLRRCILRVLAESSGMVREPEEYDKSAEELALSIRDTAAAAADLFIVAEVGHAIVGGLALTVEPRKKRRHVGTFGMWVLPEWQGRGIGRALLAALLAWAEAHPALEKIALAVFADNAPALRLYETCGFQVEGRRPRENRRGPGQYVDDILMYKFVKPATAEAEDPRRQR